jgi:hypothetical protein
MPPITLIVIFTLFILWRIFVTSKWDRDRIKEAALAKKWKIVAIAWEPFGPGWFGEKTERIYKVSYENELGQIEQKYCKTSIFTGVFWK